MARLASDERAEGFEAEPADVAAVVDGGLAERFEEVGLAGARRSADDEVLVAVDPLEGPQRALRGCGDRRHGVVPRVERLAGREGGGFAARADRGALPAGEFLGEQCPHRLGRIPALRLGGGQQFGGVSAHVGQAQLAQQLDDLVGRGGGAHDTPVVIGAAWI
jgi:hypothetical protein